VVRGLYAAVNGAGPSYYDNFRRHGMRIGLSGDGAVALPRAVEEVAGDGFSAIDRVCVPEATLGSRPRLLCQRNKDLSTTDAPEQIVLASPRGRSTGNLNSRGIDNYSYLISLGVVREFYTIPSKYRMSIRHSERYQHFIMMAQSLLPPKLNDVSKNGR
jgi:hypothetical protein